jgi:hypothetical protein
MKKKLITVKDFAAMQSKIANAKKQIKNELTEDAAELRRSLLDLLDELDNAEIEVDEAELASRIREAIDAYNRDDKSEVPAAVANAIAAKVKTLQDMMPKSEKLTPAIKNQVSAAILRATNREDVKNAVQAVLVKNGISGLEFDDVTDYAISENWGDSNRLFAALHKTPVTKFFYSAQDVTDSGVQAHGWSKESESEKIVQQINAQKKHIERQFIYKIQDVALEDLAEIRKTGSETTFLRWLNEELDRQIVNTIVSVILGSYTGSDITTVEDLHGTGASDAFRTAVATAATANAELKITDVRALCDAVANPYGKEKWLVIDQATLTKISEFVYASGGDTTYHRIEDLKGMLGVDEIYVTSLATTPVCFLPDGYWFSELTAEEVSVVYPTWKSNIVSYQKERYAGAAVHDLKSVAFFEFDEGE